jgi:hypothetical protein
MEYGDSALCEYFEMKGSVEVLLAVHPKDGTLTEDVKDSTNCSSSTAKDRIYEATDLGLLEHETHKTVDNKNAKRQFLTAKGRACMVAFVSLGLDEDLAKIKYLEENIENKKQEIKEWLRQGGDAKVNGLETGKYTELIKKKRTYPGENVPDNFASFIFPPDEDEKEEILNFEGLIDYYMLSELEED